MTQTGCSTTGVLTRASRTNLVQITSEIHRARPLAFLACRLRASLSATPAPSSPKPVSSSSIGDRGRLLLLRDVCALDWSGRESELPALNQSSAATSNVGDEARVANLEALE